MAGAAKSKGTLDSITEIHLMNRTVMLLLDVSLNLLCTLQEGMQLIAEKPETEVIVKEKLTGLHQMWEELESTTQTKAQRLFDANKAELFTQSCADLDKWLNGLECQIQSDDYGKDLTSVNILLKKQQVNEMWLV